jgi:2-isopropylmalate synthase/UPF0716 protein FxsA
MISSAISGEIGGLMTFGELILSVMLGMFILQNFKFGLMDSITKVKNGEMSQEEFVKGSIGKAIGAILLIVPGFFTDILGLLLQFSLFTVIFTKVFNFKPKTMASNDVNYSQSSYAYTNLNMHNNTNYNQTKGDEDVIDVEVIDDTKPINH